MKNGIHALLVSEDASLLARLSQYSRNQALHLDTCQSLEIHSAKLRATKLDYQVVVYDQHKNESNRNDIANQIRSRFPRAEPIILTDSENDEGQEMLLDSHIYYCLPKSVNPLELSIAVRAAAHFSRISLVSKVMKTFNAIGQRLGAVQDLKELYAQLFAEVRELLPELDGFYVTKYQKDDRNVTFPLCILRGKVESIPPREVVNSLTKFVIQRKGPILMPDGDREFRKQNNINPPDSQIGYHTSGLIAPMFFQGRPLGTLSAFTYKQGFCYTPDHLQLLQMFANQAAATIYNIDQLNEAKQLTGAASALARNHGKKDVLQAIVKEAHNLIESEFTGLIIQDENGHLKKIEPVMPPEYFTRFEDPRQVDGVTRWVVDHRQPMVIPDTSRDPLVKQSLREAGIKSMLAFPLLHEDRVLGVLYAHTFYLRHFSGHDLELWKTFATQAAAALNEATRDEKEKEDFLRLANELGSLNEKMNLTQSMQKVATAAKNIFEADTCRLAYVDPATENILKWTWAIGDQEEYRHEGEPRSEGITLHVIRTKEPVFRSADQTDKLPQPHPELVSRGLQSVASLPLIYNGRIIGVLHCNYINKREPLKKHLKMLMEAFMARAAAALNRTRRDYLDAVWRDMDRYVITESDIDKIIKEFTKRACKSFRADFAVFFPYAPSLTSNFSDLLEERYTLAGTLREPWQAPQGGKGGGVHLEVENNAKGYLIINNLKNLGGRFNSHLAEREGVEAFIAIRLMVLNQEFLPAPQLAGILFLNFRQPTFFEPGDVADLQNAGALVAAGILRLNLEAALLKSGKQRLTQLRMVNETMRTIKLKRDGLNLDLVAERAAKALGIDTCTILLHNRETGEFSKRGDYGLQHPEIHHNPRPEFKELYMEKGTPTIIEDTQADEIMSNSKFVANEKIKSTIVNPLRIEGENQGLFFANYRKLKQFAADEIESITQIADFAALVLHINTLGTKLAESKQKLDKNLFLVWVSMMEDTWRHSIIQKSSSIQNYVGSVNQIIGNKKLQVEKWMDIPSLIKEINRLAIEINNAPPRVPSSWEMEAEPVPLASLLQEVAERESKPLAMTTGLIVTIETNVEALEGVQVLGYRRWLIYCLETLIQNARGAMPKGGHVLISGVKKGAFVEIRVQDDGVGVPEEIKPFLFKERISNTNDKKGLGIGSLLAATIVDAHDGSIELEKPGPGDTTVLICLPFMKEIDRS